MQVTDLVEILLGRVGMRGYLADQPEAPLVVGHELMLRLVTDRREADHSSLVPRANEPTIAPTYHPWIPRASSSTSDARAHDEMRRTTVMILNEDTICG